jgi:hypothetical protein
LSNTKYRQFENPLMNQSKQELQDQGLSHSINLWKNENRPNYRILLIQGEISEIKQSLQWMQRKPLEREFWNDLGRQRWGTVEHAQAEITKGEFVLEFLGWLLLHGILYYEEK